MERKGGSGRVHLPSLVLARVFTCCVFMTYPACLSQLLIEWEMTAANAGIVQGAFTIAFALSLLAASFLCDCFGAKRVFKVAILLCSLTALLFGLFARSYETAIIFVVLLGLAQGGTYTPAIMLVSANTAPNKRATAVGWVLSGMSLGYVISIIMAMTLSAIYGYEAAFMGTAVMTIGGAILGHFAVRSAKGTVAVTQAGDRVSGESKSRHIKLLTIGYIGHCWELFGAWAWVPAFLVAANYQGSVSPIELGLWTALMLHLSGFLGSSLSGYAADIWGHRAVLVAFALIGTLCSLSIGWLPDMGMPLLFAVTFLYGLSIIGDSSVWSSAMTDAVPAEKLGRILGIRSILGIGVGSLSPVIVGMVLDRIPGSTAWGWAFIVLAAGGIVATVCSLMLRDR